MSNDTSLPTTPPEVEIIPPVILTTLSSPSSTVTTSTEKTDVKMMIPDATNDTIDEVMLQMLPMLYHSVIIHTVDTAVHMYNCHFSLLFCFEFSLSLFWVFKKFLTYIRSRFYSQYKYVKKNYL